MERWAGALNIKNNFDISWINTGKTNSFTSSGASWSPHNTSHRGGGLLMTQDS